MPKPGYVYMLASKPNGTLYVGETSDLLKRVWQHREGLVEGFRKRYDVKRLVYFEVLDDIETAIAREKAVKKWRRSWKLKTIEAKNPTWRDLYDDIVA